MRRINRLDSSTSARAASSDSMKSFSSSASSGVKSYYRSNEPDKLKARFESATGFNAPKYMNKDNNDGREGHGASEKASEKEDAVNKPELEERLSAHRHETDANFSRFLLEAERQRSELLKANADFREDMKEIQSSIKVDLADLKTDIVSSENRLHKWFIGTAIAIGAMVLTLIGVINSASG